MAIHYKRLTEWFDVWQDCLEDDREFLIGRTTPNLILSLYNELKEHPHGNAWADKLEAFLKDAIDANEPVIELIRVEQGKPVVELRKLIAAREGKTRAEKKMSDGRVLEVLEQIRDAPSQALLHCRLRDSLLEPPGTGIAMLTAISAVLVTRAITKRDHSDLQSEPKKIFTYYATVKLLETHVPAFEADGRLEEDLWGGWQGRFEDSLTQERLESYIKPEAEFLQDFFRSTYPWSEEVVELFQSLASRAGSVWKKRLTEDPGLTFATLPHGAGEDFRSVGEWLIRGYVRAYTECLLDLLTQSIAGDEKWRLNDVGDAIVTRLKGEGEFVNKNDRGADPNPSHLTRLAVDALTKATSRTVAENFADRVLPADLRELAATIGNRLAETFVENSSADSADSPLTPQKIDQLCIHWVTRRSLQGELARLLIPLAGNINNALVRLLGPAAETPLTILDKDLSFFWDVWKVEFSKRSTSSGTICEYVPWALLTDEQLGEIVDKFFAFFFPPAQTYFAVFKVKGIKPNGAKWTAGDVTFYDPAVFDYGEGGHFLFRDDAPLPNDLTYARVKVVAETAVAAWESALPILEYALDAFSFATSVNARAGGMRPQVLNGVFAIRESQKSGGFKAESTRAELFSVPSAESGKLSEVGSAYGKLLTLASRDPSKLKQVQAGFLRSLHWYRKGRWEPDHAERFLFYWISLEHLFAGGDKDKSKLLAAILGIHITWQNHEGLFWVLESWRALLDHIEKNEPIRSVADGRSELRRWRFDLNVLLKPENLMLLNSLSPDDYAEAKAYFLKCAEDFQKVVDEKEDHRQAVEKLRELFEFKLRLLYGLRHELVHEALTYRKGMRLYAETLEAIVEDVLRKIVTTAIQETPDYDSVENLAEWYQLPW